MRVEKRRPLRVVYSAALLLAVGVSACVLCIGALYIIDPIWKDTVAHSILSSAVAGVLGMLLGLTAYVAYLKLEGIINKSN